MILCVLNSNQFEALFGSPDNRTPKDDIVIIGQAPDCSAFLVLTNTVYPQLTEHAEVPDGFYFTYRQDWGLTINTDVIDRVIQQLRKDAYPPVENYLDGIVKGDQGQVDEHVSACLAVKAQYPKMVW